MSGKVIAKVSFHTRAFRRGPPSRLQIKCLAGYRYLAIGILMLSTPTVQPRRYQLRYRTLMNFRGKCGHLSGRVIPTWWTEVSNGSSSSSLATNDLGGLATARHRPSINIEPAKRIVSDLDIASLEISALCAARPLEIR